MKQRIKNANARATMALMTVMSAGVLGGLLVGIASVAAMSTPVWMPTLYIRTLREEDPRLELPYQTLG